VLASDGTELHVEVHEPSDPAAANLTVIFSHGFALNSDAWHYARRDLAPLARLVAYDQRSHGRSGRALPDTLTIDQLGDDLARVLTDVAPEGPVVLVGHSMGGMSIMALADQRPELFGGVVRAVVLIATTAGGIPELELGLSPRLARFLHGSTRGLPRLASIQPDLVDLGRARSNDLSLLLMKWYSFGDRVPMSETKFVADMISATPIEVVAGFLPALERHDKRSALPAFRNVRTLVIAGDRDLLTPVSHSDAIVDELPLAELIVLPRAGHMSPTQKHLDVNRGIMQLVETVRSEQD
jgi:pimeloyl-ACP methyl ester carboxylesterase